MPDAGKLRGYARPLFPGASVALQRFNGSSWRTVARATIDESGSFEGTVHLVPGDYRARLAPGRGFVARREPDAEGGTGMRRLALAIFVLALAAPGSASAARFAIGVEKGADSRARRTADRVAHRQRGLAGSARSPSPSAPQRRSGLSSLTGVAWVERIRGSRRLTFTPSDPLAVKQWYLSRIHAFDAWSQAPNLRASASPSSTPASTPATLTSRTESRTASTSSPAPGRTTRTGTAPSSPARSPRLSTTPRESPGVGFPATAARREDRPLRRDDLARRRGRSRSAGRSTTARASST